MSKIVELQQRAAELSAKYQKESITPEEVGLLHEDTLQYIADLERYVDNLGVRKVYASKAELDADTAPVGTNGKTMKFGQLAVIRSTDADNGNIYAFQKPGWLLIGNLNEGQVINDLITGGSNVPLSAEQGKVLDGKIEAAVGSIPAVADNLSTDDATKALSAKQGKALFEMATEYDVSAHDGGKAYTLAGTAQVVHLTVTTAPTADADITITLGGTATTVTLTAATQTTPALVAAQIAGATYAGYNVAYTDGNAYVDFTASAIGEKAAPVLAVGSTGAVGSLAVATIGSESAIAAVPAEFQRGGLTIAFVNAVSGEYVKYFCNGSAWSQQTEHWDYMQLNDRYKISTGTVNIVGRYLIDGGFSLKQDGSLYSVGVYSVSDFVSLDNISAIEAKLASRSPWLKLAFYDADKNFVSGLISKGTLSKIEIPATAAYMRYMYYAADNDVINVTSYDIRSTRQDIEDISNRLDEIEGNTNVTIYDDPIDIMSGTLSSGYISITGGVVDSHVWWCTDYIDVTDAYKIVVSLYMYGTQGVALAFFTADKDIMSKYYTTAAGTQIEIPVGAKYVRASYSTGRGSYCLIYNRHFVPVNQFAKENILPAGLYKDKVTLHNADCVIVEGSSLTASIACPVGFGWLSKINDLVDIPIINDGRQAKRRKDNIASLADGQQLVMSTAKTSALNYTYVLWQNAANSTPVGLDGFKELLICKKITEGRNAVMLLGDEEWAGDYDALNQSFAGQFGLKKADSIYKVGGSLSFGYSGLVRAGHGGWRYMAKYASNVELFKSLALRRSVKLYRPRPEISIDGVASLVFDDDLLKAKKWKAINSGQDTTVSLNRSVTFNAADNIDKTDATLDTAFDYAANPLDTNSSEVAAFLAGGDIAFNGYALIGLVLNVSKLKDASVTFRCSQSPRLYVLKHTFTADSNGVYTTFVEVTTKYEDGVVIADLSEIEDVLDYDKLYLAVYYDGDYTVGEVACEYSGVQKFLSEKPFANRKTGQELLSTTSIDDTTLGGATLVTPPADLGLKTSRNTSNSLVKMIANTDTMSKTFSLVADGRVAIRITAQNFYKFATTRFSGDEYADYVTTDDIGLRNNSYDYGGIIVSIDSKYIKTAVVWSGFQEVYLELDLAKGSHTIKVQRNSYDDITAPILIHDLSIQQV